MRNLLAFIICLIYYISKYKYNHKAKSMLNYLIVAVLVIMSGLFSGLTIGLFSLNLSSLERKMNLGNVKATKVYSIRKNGNLLLCTLLLGNVAVNSAMAVFLGTIAEGVIAGLIATGLITIFGEIVPQAVFSRFALYVGAKTVWLVKFFMFVLFPITKPIAMFLNKILGAELPTIWSKREIAEIIKSHEDSPDSPLDADEERIMLGAISFSDKAAKHILTPRTVVFMLEVNEEITADLLTEIRAKAFSRIPVYEDSKDNIIGIIFVKDLIGIKIDEKIHVKDIFREDVIFAKETIKLDKLFNILINRRSHMSIIYDDLGIFQGIVTMEDIIEEIINQEILDEEDYIENMQEFAREKFKRDLYE